MKVLCYWLYGRGGGFTNLKRLLSTTAMCCPDDEFLVLTLDSCDVSELEALENVRIIRRRATIHKEITRMLLGWQGVRRLAAAHSVDVVWSVNFGSYVRLGIPQVLMLNNAYQVLPWSSVSKSHPAGEFSLFMIRRAFRRALSVTNCVIVQTEAIKRCLQNQWGYSGQVEVIAKAVVGDNDRIDNLQISQAIGRAIGTNREKFDFTFLYVAIAMPHKNHKVLFEAARRLRERRIPIRIAVTLTADQIVSASHEWGPVRDILNDGYIVPLGWVGKEDLAPLYGACDGCVMPSTIESLSSAHLEAMQWEKPQVCAALPYATDLCGEAAVYASPDDPEQWVEKMLLLRGDSDVRTRLTMHGRRRMQQFPSSWEEMSQQVHKVLLRNSCSRGR